MYTISMKKQAAQVSEFLLYKSHDGEIKVDVFFQDENVWLTQKRMAELFDVDRSVITKHIQNIFESGELDQESVCAKIAHTAEDGKTYTSTFYNLDAIISVGYRVNSARATQFRIWATKTLKEYMIKGFAIDDDRLKNGQHFGKDYFEELLEKIREIRASERRFYQKITRGVLGQKAKTTAPEIDVKTYVKYILQEGTKEERRELLGCLKDRLTLKDQRILIEEPQRK